MVFTENCEEIHVYDVIRKIRCNKFIDLLNVAGEFKQQSVFCFNTSLCDGIMLV